MLGSHYNFLLRLSNAEAAKHERFVALYVNMMDLLFTEKYTSQEELIEIILLHSLSAMFKYMPGIKEIRPGKRAEEHIKVSREMLSNVVNEHDRKILTAYSYFVESSVMRGNNEFNQSVKSSEMALKLFQELHAPPIILGHAFCELGMNQVRAKNLAEADMAFQKAHQYLSAKSNNTDGLLGRIAERMEANNGDLKSRILKNYTQYLNAAGQYQKTVDIIKPQYESIMHSYQISYLAKANISQVYGEAFLILQNYNDAEKYFKETEKHLSRNTPKDKLYHNWQFLRLKLNLATVFFEKSDYQKSIPELNEALRSIKALQLKPEHDFVKAFRAIKNKLQSVGLTGFNSNILLAKQDNVSSSSVSSTTNTSGFNFS